MAKHNGTVKLETDAVAKIGLDLYNMKTKHGYKNDGEWVAVLTVVVAIMGKSMGLEVQTEVAGPSGKTTKG